MARATDEPQSAEITHNNAETLSVEAAGVEFAYRRFGSPAELPLVMLQHFRGNRP
jgi:hypothetical protein